VSTMALMIIRCHRTQAGESPILVGAASSTTLSERQRLFLGSEHFRPVVIRGEHGDGVHPDVLGRHLTEENPKSRED